MRYIIDTHILLWLLFEPEKLSKKILEILENPQNDVAVTSISFFEISIKYNLGKLNLYGTLPEELPGAAREMGLKIEQIDVKTMASFYKLPKYTHKDPFDRIVIWHCISTNAVLVSYDGKFGEYEKEGLRVLK